MTTNTLRDFSLLESSRTHSPGTVASSLVAGRAPAGPAARRGSARARKAERHRLLTQELNHRVKNLLATVQAIARQSLRTARTLEEFEPIFGARLRAVAATNDRLIAGEWQGADLRDLLCAELEPYGEAGTGTRVHLQGGPAQLPAGLSQSIGLIFHELITNAIKYGALSSRAGRVDISWTERATTDGRALRIEWVESGGPLVRAPTHRGFGSKLLERSLAAQGGSASVEFDPKGLRCTIEVRCTGAC